MRLLPLISHNYSLTLLSGPMIDMTSLLVVKLNVVFDANFPGCIRRTLVDHGPVNNPNE